MVKILGEMESRPLICVNNTPDLLKYGTECRIGVSDKKAARTLSNVLPCSINAQHQRGGGAGTESTLSLPAGKLQRTGLLKR
jgi:hypothetical protein